jgi:N-acetylated-alpha-linked acidic dipeptidase
MRLADDELLPFRFTNLADTVNRYIEELQKMLKKQRDDARERNQELEEGVFAATSDPREPTVAPPAKAVPPHLNFAPLENAADALTRSAERYDKALAKVRAEGSGALASERVRTVNAALLGVDRAMLDTEGLPKRPWFKNAVYAPGMYTGYGVKTIPMVREAIELEKWQEAGEGIVRTGKVLEASRLPSTGRPPNWRPLQSSRHDSLSSPRKRGSRFRVACQRTGCPRSRA